MPTPEERQALIEKIRSLPAQLEAVVKDLSDEELTTHYMENEWTVAQNVHHVADVHMNVFLRMKQILTLDKPALQAYNPDDWANLYDANNKSVADSLVLIKGLHARWCAMLENIKEEDWGRVGIHPRHGEISLDRQLAIYSGHGEAHIKQIKETLAARKD